MTLVYLRRGRSPTTMPDQGTRHNTAKPLPAKPQECHSVPQGTHLLSLQGCEPLLDVALHYNVARVRAPLLELGEGHRGLCRVLQRLDEGEHVREDAACIRATGFG